MENVFLTHSWEYIFEFAGVFRPHGLTCPAHPPLFRFVEYGFYCYVSNRSNLQNYLFFGSHLG